MSASNSAPIAGWAARSSQKGRPKDRKSTRLNSSHGYISYAVFCLKKKKKEPPDTAHHLHRPLAGAPRAIRLICNPALTTYPTSPRTLLPYTLHLTLRSAHARPPPH